MKRAIAWMLTVSMLFAFVGCTSKTTNEQNVQGRVQQAKDMIGQLESGDYAGVFNKFNSTMQQAVPQATLSSQWQAVHTQYGTFKEHVSYTVEQAQGYLRVVLVDRFIYATLSVSVVFDSNGKIAGLFISEAHDVDDGRKLPTGIVEENVTVTTGNYKLSGKLTLPNSGSNFPAVVIVHGSGPMDMDGSVLNLKPYRDIAWGLAQKGIAVLRYDKRTLAYAQSVAADQNVTVNEESVDDTVSAVNLLRQDKRINANQIYIAGHSLGGMLLPRIQQKANANGLIYLAATARSLVDQYQRQMAYLTDLAVKDKSITQQQADATLTQVQTTVQNIKSLTLESTLTADKLMGVPKAYWLDLKSYDPLAAAASLNVPMLFLQGERDYQVTMDDLALWQNALKGKANVSYKSFKLLGHLFTPGNETPSQKDYRTEYVQFDQSAIDAMVAFILKK